jgi:hypothetical protein
MTVGSSGVAASVSAWAAPPAGRIGIAGIAALDLALGVGAVVA